jgi:potassium/chloride transporter 9
MSGDLKHASKAIPKGTLYGLGLTFLLYTIVILAMGASITRSSFYENANVIQLVGHCRYLLNSTFRLRSAQTNISGVVILLGEFATSAFSVLMGVIGSAKLLQALARDHLLPGLSVFGQGTDKSDDPTYAIIITYILAQLTMLSDINQIASFITMTYLMTFLVTNLACFLLKIGSAPNFRPSFHFFNWQTAAAGTIISGATMFFVDGVYASGCVGILIVMFLLIHYTTPPKPWGDVSQSLIYHQVRKYLLRLRQEHVKFWRPQILLLVNDPRRQYRLIQFCNSLKKGALFVLGHVIVSQDFGAAVPEARRQQQLWTKYIDFSRIKAFINIAISPAVEWGARNIVLGSGLGGMRPNIVVMGFYNLGELRHTNPLIDIPSPQPSRPASKAAQYPTKLSSKTMSKEHDIPSIVRRKTTDTLTGMLPTDAMRPENAIGIQSYVTILEDLVLRLQINVALAKGFQELDVPSPKPSKRQRLTHFLGLAPVDEDESTKKYIDLWPIQMSAEIATSGEGLTRKNVLTTNFDTYTLILQLGCILHTVPSWKRTYRLRVCVFVEYETDVEEEKARVTTLLKNLRIEADIVVFGLASGDLKMYEVIINANASEDSAQASKDVDDTLKNEVWWQDMQRLRRPVDLSASQELVQAQDFLDTITNWPTASFQHGRHESKPKRFAGFRRMLRRTKHKTSVANLGEAGLKIGMRTQRLPADLLSDSGSSSSDNEEEAVVSDSDAATENGIDEYDLDDSDEEPTMPYRRAKSMSAGIGIPSLFGRKLNLPRRLWQEDMSNVRPTKDPDTPLKPHADAIASDRALLATASSLKHDSGVDQLSSSPRTALTARPPPMRSQSLSKFTSNTTPRTAVASEVVTGPSIMFVDTPSPSRTRNPDPIATSTSAEAVESAALRDPTLLPSTKAAVDPATRPTGLSQPLSSSSDPQPTASGFPLPQSIPLSFNDLPCRAQHLILNELIRQNSDDTAVVFTTLPSPVEGTCQSEEESVKFISDLEVLCQGLPPVLLVHSNSMTVTMNL